jgi:hypothetical protein
MELEFEPEAHVYKVDGRVLPSVTGIISSLQDFRYVAPDVLHAAAEFGTAVHKLCELHDQDNLDMRSVSPALLPYLDAWKRFLSETGAVVLEVEKQYHHKMMGYAGTLDRVLLIKKKKVVTDIKSVSRLSPAVGVQLAAYQNLLSANSAYVCNDRAAVQLRDDGTYRYQPYTDPTDWPVFVSLLTLHTWKKKYAA